MMPPQQEQQFDDPHLKDAVRRCWACDCAPKALQNQVAKMLAESTDWGKSSHRPMGKLSWVIWPVALAASVVLAVGIARRVGNHPAIIDLPAALPVSLETELIQRHDYCSKLPNHQHLKVPKDDDNAIARAMQGRLNNRAVLVFHPQNPAWEFRGASVCPVGTTPSGHLVFVKGHDSLSIFSLPKSLVPNAADGNEFNQTMDHHYIAGFVKDGALFCAVSTAPISMDEIKAMESKVQTTVARLTAPRAPSPVVLTELLQPIAH